MDTNDTTNQTTDQAAAPDSATDETPLTDTTDDDAEETDWKAEARRWERQAKYEQKRAGAARAALEQELADLASETGPAAETRQQRLAAAREEGHTAGFAETAGSRLETLITKALRARGHTNPHALAETLVAALDVAKFVHPGGEIDPGAVLDLVDAVPDPKPQQWYR